MKNKRKEYYKKLQMEKIAEQVRKELLQQHDSLSAAVSPQERDAARTSGPGTETGLLIDFLEKRHDFRYNVVMGYAEYRDKGNHDTPWLPVDERVANTLTMDARLNGICVWDKEVKRYLGSNHLKDFNPITSYIDKVRGCWDGHDHIADLASCVKTTCRQWPQWLRRWLLAMVAQWTGRNKDYGNAMAPLLISEQGYGKSTFCKAIIPKELSWGYIDNIVMAEKKQVLCAMTEMLLINLDEFNQISPSLQSGFLKNVIQLATVKVKRPYGRHVEEFKRLASFIATTNMADVLTDPSGNRRFMGIEIVEPIDMTHMPKHQQLYAQIVHLLEQGERYWFDTEETLTIMNHNKQYKQKSASETFFNEFFEVTQNEQEGCYMSTAQIYDTIRRKAGSRISERNIINFGRMLAHTEGIVRRRGKRGSEYLVKLR